jgi:hypothetical protein
MGVVFFYSDLMMAFGSGPRSSPTEEDFIAKT